MNAGNFCSLCPDRFLFAKPSSTPTSVPDTCRAHSCSRRYKSQHLRERQPALQPPVGRICVLEGFTHKSKSSVRASKGSVHESKAFAHESKSLRARALQIKKAPGSLFQLLGARCLAVKTLVVAAGWQLRRKFVYCKYAETFPLICKREISQSLVLYWALRMRSSASRRLFWASRISMPERFPSM